MLYVGRIGIDEGEGLENNCENFFEDDREGCPSTKGWRAAMASNESKQPSIPQMGLIGADEWPDWQEVLQNSKRFKSGQLEIIVKFWI